RSANSLFPRNSPCVPSLSKIELIGSFGRRSRCREPSGTGGNAPLGSRGLPLGTSMMGIDTAKAVRKYDLLEKIAEGGMGAIYRGRHRESGQVVAIKIMPAHMAQNAVLLKRFEQEFRAASRLDHANIVRALDYGDNGNMPYLVMEFVEGESL